MNQFFFFFSSFFNISHIVALTKRLERQDKREHNRQAPSHGAYIQEEGDIQFRVNKVAELNQMILFLKSFKCVTFPSFVLGV